MEDHSKKKKHLTMWELEPASPVSVNTQQTCFALDHHAAHKKDASSTDASEMKLLSLNLPELRFLSIYINSDFIRESAVHCLSGYTVLRRYLLMRDNFIHFIQDNFIPFF